MSPWSFPRALLRHVLVAALVTAPVLLTGYGVTQWARGAAEEDSLGGVLLDLTVLYPGVALFTAAGAVVLTAALALARRRAGGAGRGTLLVLSPLLLVPWALLPARAVLSWPPMLPGIVAGLLVFVLLADTGHRPLPRQAAG